MSLLLAQFIGSALQHGLFQWMGAQKQNVERYLGWLI